LPPARGGKCLETSDQIFQIAVISEYVTKLVEIRSVTSKIRRQKNKKKTTAVKYKLRLGRPSVDVDAFATATALRDLDF